MDNFNTLFAFQDDGICGDVWANYIFTLLNSYNPKKVLVLSETDEWDAVGTGDGLNVLRAYPLHGHEFVQIEYVKGQPLENVLQIIKESDAEYVYWLFAVEELKGVTSELVVKLSSIEKSQTFIYYPHWSSLKPKGEVIYGSGVTPRESREFYQLLNVERHEGYGISDESIFDKTYPVSHLSQDKGWTIMTKNELSVVPASFLFPTRLETGDPKRKVKFIEDCQHAYNISQATESTN